MSGRTSTQATGSQSLASSMGLRSGGVGRISASDNIEENNKRARELEHEIRKQRTIEEERHGRFHETADESPFHHHDHHGKTTSTGGSGHHTVSETKKIEEETQDMRIQRQDSEKLTKFMTSMGYGETDVNGKRRSLHRYYLPLHDAVESNDAEMVKLLLAARADQNAKSSSGKTPLERAMARNNCGSHAAVLAMLGAPGYAP
mmetsp:Transcript_24611/g.56801  ORF Transcript_24611/g.56801 Transcript_24611/m.56801 type:complete len:203 (+) Transcript_24611:72-680(+)